jgi:hypothetical protein
MGLQMIKSEEPSDDDIDQLAVLAEEFVNLNGKQCPTCKQGS